VSVSVSNADTTPPTVTITAPANNATVSGSAVTVTASASDNVTVAGVQFKLDGVSVWVEDTLPPYSVSWDTATISSGPHTLTATARDGSGNTATSTAVIVTVSNATGKSLTIDGAQVFQTIDGFGVNANSLSWNNGELKPAIDMLVDQMGATIWRVVFDMEDWETPNDNADPNTFEPTYYTALYSNAKFKNLWGTIGYLNQKGIDSNLVISFMGRVPVWMGGDHIDSTLEDEWVETIASLVNYGRAVQGVRFGALDPINEPDWDGIEGPRVDEFQYTRLLRKLSLRLDSLGYSDLKLIGPNTASIDTGVNTYMPAMMSDSVVMSKVDHLAFHNYAGYTANASARIQGSAYPGRNFWITETTNPWDIMTHIGQGPGAVLVWDAYDSVYNHAILAGRGTAPPNDAGNGPSPLSYDPATGIYTPRKSFYQDAQIFRFVRGGSVRIGAAQPDPNVTLYAFWHQAAGRLTIVGRNTGGSTVTMAAAIRNLPAVPVLQLYQTHEIDATVNVRRANDVVATGNSFSFSVPAYSMVTLTSSGPSDTSPPAVSITAPTDGSTISGSATVTADATDNVGIAGVQFKADGVNLGAEVTVAPYAVNWNTTVVTNGTHSVWGVARDAAGNSTTSSAVTVTVNNVDTTPPTISLSAPADGATVSGTVTISANASDDLAVARVQFLLDGANLGPDDPTAPYAMNWNSATASNGPHTLSARAYDTAGNAGVSGPITVVVNNDLTPPAVSLTSPADLATASGTTTVTASASDNVGVAGVQFLLDGAFLNPEVTVAPYSTSWNTSLAANGNHSLAARARDGAGNTTTSTAITVTVNNVQPSGLVASFGFNEGTGTVAADASPTANNGSVTGATWTTAGRYGAALSFNGSSSYVNLTKTDVYDSLTQGTIEAWVKWSGTGYDTWFSSDSGACVNPFELAINNGRFEVWADGSGCAGKFNAYVTLTNPTAWHHLAYVVSTTGNTFYVDGVLQAATYAIGTSSSTFFFASAAANVTRYNIGRSINLPSESFAGVIDELRIYNRPLTQAEIQADMNTPIAALLPAADPAGAAPTRTFMQRVERSLREVGETISNAERAERSLTMRFSDSRRAQRARR
jgi:hypothetical protein